MKLLVRKPGSSVLRDRLGRRAPDLAIGGLKPAERDVEGQLLAVELDPQRGGELAEQTAPGGLAGDRLLGEDLLLGLGEEVRAIAPDALEVMAAEVELLGGEQLLDPGVVQRGPFELEEQEQRLDLGGAFLYEL